MSKYSNNSDVKRVTMVKYLDREVNDEKLSKLWKIQTSKIMVNFKQLLKIINYVTIWNSSHLRPNFLSLKNKSEISKKLQQKPETSTIDTFKLQNILVVISSKSRVKTTKWRILGKSINYFNSRNWESQLNSVF